jgi:hypothetical protein
MMKKSDLYREYARVIDMCEGTDVNPLKCVKLKSGMVERWKRPPMFKSCWLILRR